MSFAVLVSASYRLIDRQTDRLYKYHTMHSFICPCTVIIMEIQSTTKRQLSLTISITNYVRSREITHGIHSYRTTSALICITLSIWCTKSQPACEDTNPQINSRHLGEKVIHVDTENDINMAVCLFISCQHHVCYMDENGTGTNWAGSSWTTNSK